MIRQRTDATSGTKQFHDICNNCGKHGHTFKQCKHPITSFGVIIFRINPNKYNKREYLMIRRKDTLGYIDFMRGKYSVSNHNYILNMLKQMTEHEKNKLAKYTFEELWTDLWSSDTVNTDSVDENDASDPPIIRPSSTPAVKLSNSYRQEELNSREKFLYLTRTPMRQVMDTMPDTPLQDVCGNNHATICVSRSSPSILQHLLMVSNIPDLWTCEANPIPAEGGGWKEPEWGFPKGRRNHQENDYECALREMTEETGIPCSMVNHIKNVLPFDESFIGSNYKSYKHRYFLMYMEYQDSISLFSDSFEKSEVSRMEWKTYQECMDSIRPYNLEKKRLIQNIEIALSKYRLVL